MFSIGNRRLPKMKNLAFVIEDNNDISNLFFRALVEAGFLVEIISNGEVALARLEKESPTLIILDMHLPEVSGATLLTYIRTTEHLKDTKVVIATADAQLGELHSHKADLLLEKPITFSQLRDLAMRFNQ
jgi:CheY-like chemotaxis protein